MATRFEDRNGIPTEFFDLPEFVESRAIPDAEIASMAPDPAVIANLESMNFFVFDRQCRGTSGQINQSLFDASILASNILASNIFAAGFLAALCSAWQISSPKLVEIRAMKHVLRALSEKKFFVTMDNYANSNSHMHIFRAGPKRFIFVNKFLLSGLDEHTDGPAADNNQAVSRRRLAVSFLAVKLVHEASHWLHSILRANHFYCAEKENCKYTISPPAKMGAYRLTDFGGAVEAFTVGGIFQLIAPPHPFMAGYAIRMGIGEVRVAQHADNKTTWHTLHTTGPFTPVTLRLAECKGNLVFGALTPVPAGKLPKGVEKVVSETPAVEHTTRSKVYYSSCLNCARVF